MEGHKGQETPLTFLSPGGSLGECENSLLLKGFPHAVCIASFHSKTSNPSTQQPAGHTACLPARTPAPARQGAARGAPSTDVRERLPASCFLGSPGLGHCAPGPSKMYSLFSEISRKPDPGESWPLLPSLHISHADLFYGEGSPLFLMVTIAIKQILNYVGVNHPAGGLK